MHTKKIPVWVLLSAIVALGVLSFSLGYYPDRSVLEGTCGVIGSALWFFLDWVVFGPQRRPPGKGNTFGLV